MLQKLDDYRTWLLGITICDPACGSGAFLNAALEFLIEEHHIIDELSNKLMGSSLEFRWTHNDILENNLYGVDINEEAVEIARLSLWLRTAQKGRKLTNLSNNIKVGNSVVEEINESSNKPFIWKDEFKEVFVNGGFDVIIGNPPYVRQELLGAMKEYLSKNYHVFNYVSDLFAYFYELAFKILKPEGFFGFISNTFDKTTAGIDLRMFLKNKTVLRKYVDFTEIQIFEGATTYPIIVIAINKPPTAEATFSFIKIQSDSKPETGIDLFKNTAVLQSSLNKNSWGFNSLEANKLLDKLKLHKTIRSVYGKSFYGIKTGFNEAFIIDKKTREEIIRENARDGELIKPFYEGKDLRKWHTPEIDKYLIFTKRGTEINIYPAIKNWLSKYREKLEPRNEGNATIGRKPGPYKWFEIQDSVDYYRLFESPKITWNNLQARNKFCYDDKGYYINAPCVIFPTDSKTLLAILNSKLIWYFLKSICAVRSGGYIEVKPQYFEQIPIPVITSNSAIPIEELAESMLNKNKNLQEIKLGLLDFLASKFEAFYVSKALANWTSLTFKEFIRELEKSKIKLSLPEQKEWLQYFETEKERALAIQDVINQTDAEIDEMVYALYELTEDEIAIIEGT